MNKLEFGDLNRFLVSLGLALIVGSAALVWLSFHEQFYLTLTEEQLGQITPLAKQIILSRQQWIGSALNILPFIGIVGVVLGMFVLCIGLYRWLPLQRDYEKLQELARRKGELELQQMSAAEVVAEARSEITLQQPAALQRDLSQQGVDGIEDAVADYLETESALLDTLAERLPEGYELLPHQRFGLFTFDAFLRPQAGQGPEYVVEFKKLSSGVSTRHLVDALRLVSDAAAWIGFDRKPLVPLVIAVTPEMDGRFLEEATRFLRKTTGNPTPYGSLLVRFVSLQRLKSLSARDIEAFLDTSQRLLVFSDEQSPLNKPHATSLERNG